MLIDFVAVLVAMSGTSSYTQAYFTECDNLTSRGKLQEELNFLCLELLIKNQATSSWKNKSHTK